MIDTASPNGAALLRVEELTVEFRGGGLFSLGRSMVHAVRNVSFSVGRGEAYGLVGESGSGKTTTGRCVLGLQSPTKGSIRLADDDVGELRRRDPEVLHRRIQAVFQNPIASLNPAMTVEMILAEPLRRLADVRDRDDARRRSIELLDEVRLPREILNRRPTELSGGQAQRVSIARALASHPMLIVLDEAVSALDVATQAQVINLLAELRDETGVSYLFIAHDLAVVRHLSDRIGVMSNGEIVEEGPASDICRTPSHEYTQRLLAAVPVPDPTVKRVRRDPNRDESVETQD
ncbi:ATP-binding cassette domain-containing protein [Candidatus Poriferisodalis sp.]|uniref:ATP-binding cassette domain-containing protein n=1 Tax=Candidatus Poriferisodalis sp. TaxID=3101277 RepID=UPI003B015CA8